jgi:hypothetical protein
MSSFADKYKSRLSQTFYNVVDSPLSLISGKLNNGLQAIPIHGLTVAEVELMPTTAFTKKLFQPQAAISGRTQTLLAPPRLHGLFESQRPHAAPGTGAGDPALSCITHALLDESGIRSKSKERESVATWHRSRDDHAQP